MLSLFIATLLALAMPTAAMAFLAHPASWRQTSDDGRYVLVMVSPLPVDEDADHSAFDAQEIRSIRATYAQSGLYPNDGTATPLWTMPYHDWTHKAFLDANANNLVLAHDNWQDSYGHVVSFYSKGNRLRAYSITDLVASLQFKTLITGQAIDCRGVAFNSRPLTFTMRTNQGESFVFDVRTGKILHHSSPFPMGIGIVVAVLVMAGIFLAFVVRRSGALRMPKTLHGADFAASR